MSHRMNAQGFDELISKPSVPEVLYYYCSAASLKGIIENREIWMGSSCFLNDPLEWIWLQQIAIQHLSVKRNAHLRQGSGRRDRDCYFELFQELQTPKEVDRLGNFIACFSESVDDLGQWRAYANDGQGFCIGFRTSAFTQPFQKVIYSAERQEAVVERILDAFIGDPRNPKSDFSPEACLHLLQQIQPLMKSSCYEQEAEWRIVERRNMIPHLNAGMISHPGREDVKLRLSNEAIVPYLAIPLSPESISSVTLGPRQPEPSASRYTIKMLLARNGFTEADIAINFSAAPYRGK